MGGIAFVMRMKNMLLFFVMWVGLAAATVFAQNQDSSSALKALIRMEARALGKKTMIHFSDETRQILNRYAESVLSKIIFNEDKNVLHIANPDLHRMICLFVTNYVYAIESHDLPKETQIYLVIEEAVRRDPQLVVEIKNIQHIFNSCQNLELQLKQSGIIYFSWDNSAYLNSISVDMRQTKETADLEIPEMFRDDPLLASLYKTAAVYETRLRQKDEFVQQLSDETVRLMLEGVKYEMMERGDEKIDLGEVATNFLKKAGKEIGRDIAERIWKKKRTIITTLTRDDADLFIVKQQKRRIAEALTNLVAVPGTANISEQSFVDSLKNILDGDAKIKLKVGREKIYAGFSITFE